MTTRLTPRPGGPARLRALLESGETIVAPGAFDPLAARLVEEAGFPATLLAATAAMRRVLGEIARSGTPAGVLAGLPAFGDFLDFIGLPAVREAEQRYSS